MEMDHKLFFIDMDGYGMNLLLRWIWLDLDMDNAILVVVSLY